MWRIYMKTFISHIAWLLETSFSGIIFSYFTQNSVNHFSTIFQEENSWKMFRGNCDEGFCSYKIKNNIRWNVESHEMFTKIVENHFLEFHYIFSLGAVWGRAYSFSFSFEHSANGKGISRQSIFTIYIHLVFPTRASTFWYRLSQTAIMCHK